MGDEDGSDLGDTLTEFSPGLRQAIDQLVAIDEPRAEEDNRD